MEDEGIIIPTKPILPSHSTRPQQQQQQHQLHHQQSQSFVPYGNQHNQQMYTNMFSMPQNMMNYYSSGSSGGGGHQNELRKRAFENQHHFVSQQSESNPFLGGGDAASVFPVNVVNYLFQFSLRLFN